MASLLARLCGPGFRWLSRVSSQNPKGALLRHRRHKAHTASLYDAPTITVSARGRRVMGPVSTVLVGSRLPLSWANRRLLAACLRAGARGHASRAGSEPAICSTTTPFDAALAAFEAHGREHLQGTVLVCDGTYLATAVRCTSSRP